MELLNENVWQSTQSGFLLAQKILFFATNEFKETILKICRNYFEYKEHRVRESVADCVGELANIDGIKIYNIVKSDLFGIIDKNMVRSDVDASGPEKLKQLKMERIKNNESIGILSELITTFNKDDSDMKDLSKPVEMKHDTEGWKSLWSALKTIERIIFNLEIRFNEAINQYLLDLVFKLTSHINRFVREVTYYIYARICKAISNDKLSKNNSELGFKLANIIAKGLSDNWSQVRYSSSHACREFFDKIDTWNKKKQYFPILLPGMSLNRYYVAAGVRTYSIESWKRLVVNKGRFLVAEYIGDICKYYCSQAGADNHAVREAACHCIAELAKKVEHKPITKYVNLLLDALIACFKDMSWPVRDAACVAIADFVTAFPVQSEVDLDKDLYHLYFEHLSDNIPSVRENSADSIGKIIKIKENNIGKKCLDLCIKHLNEYLMKVKLQPKDTQKYGNHKHNGNDGHNHNHAHIEPNIKFPEMENVTLFGVAHKKLRDNDPNLHSNQQQYSCGSLNPKIKSLFDKNQGGSVQMLKKATRSGCMDHGFTRHRNAWEYTDGSVHLLKNVVLTYPEYIDKYINDIITILGIKSFAQYTSLQCTIWDSLIIIAQGIGKYKYKKYLPLLVNPMCDTLQCHNRLAQNSCAKCINFSCKFIGGKTFFKARFDDYQWDIITKSNFVRI